MELIAVKELLPLTGYIRGGCSPIGMKKKYPTYIDEVCILCDEIAVSAGMSTSQDPNDANDVRNSILVAVTVQEDKQGNIKVVKADVDENRELARKYRVMSVPTLLVIKNGETVSRSLGVQSKEKILSML